jgi:hypothetical protein
MPDNEYVEDMLRRLEGRATAAEFVLAEIIRALPDDIARGRVRHAINSLFEDEQSPAFTEVGRGKHEAARTILSRSFP